MKLKIKLCIHVLLWVFALQAQQINPTVLPTQGGTLQGGNNVVNYSMGQAFSSVLQGGSNIITVGFEQPGNVITVGNVTGGPFCVGSTINIPFNAQGIYGSGNIFTAQLADSSGSFASPVTIGVDSILGYDTIKSTKSLTVTGGKHYRIRVVSSYPVFTGAPSSFLLIGPPIYGLTPTQQDSIVCRGSSSNIYVSTSQMGILYNLIVNSTVISSGYGNDSALALSTGAIDSNTTFIVTATDTTTGCNIQLIPYLTIYTYKIGTPANVAPQAVLTDTTYTFTFNNVTAGIGGNQIIWALDSNFTIAHTDTSPATIAVTIPPGSDTLIWLKSRDSVSGCTSYAITTIAIANTISVIDTIPDTIQVICAGNATIASVQNSLPGVLYKLVLASTTVDSSMGNDSTLILNTGFIDTSTAFNIIGTDTATHSIVYIDTSIYVVAIQPVDTPVFVTGDALISAHDTSWAPYYAYAANSTQTTYSIVSGTAVIDSLTGALDSIAGNSFTIKATACGLPGCDTTTAYLTVNITYIDAPVAPAPQRIAVDSPQQVTFNFGSIYAGTGANEIEWSFNPDFSASTVLASPATISFTLPTPADTVFYLRSKDAKSGNVSRGASSSASTAYKLLVTGLLDKRNWVYNRIWSDEFEYQKPLPGDNPAFGRQWSLAHCLGWPGSAIIGQQGVTGAYDDYSGVCTNNKNIGCDHVQGNFLADVDGFMLQNGISPPDGGTRPGDHGEVTFANGTVQLLAKQDLNCRTCTTGNYYTFNHNLTPGACDADSLLISNGMFYSNIPMDLTKPGIIEMRALLPAAHFLYTDTPNIIIPFRPNMEFWNNNVPSCSNNHDSLTAPRFVSPNGYNELDIMDGPLWAPGGGDPTTGYGTNARGGVAKWDCNTEYGCNNGIGTGVAPNGSSNGCAYNVEKQTPCGYGSNWRTWTAEWAKGQITYFIDGKAFWIYNYGALNTANGHSDWTAYQMNDSAFWTIEMSALSYLGTISMHIDYLRYYTPASTNTTAQCFQNLRGTASPYTLETPGQVGVVAMNNIPALVVNNPSQTSSSITPGCNIGILNTVYNTQLFYNVNGRVYTYNRNTSVEQRIYASYVYYTSTVNEYRQVIWTRHLITAPNDVKGFITPVFSTQLNANVIYYQNTLNGISYYVNLGSNWQEFRAFKSGNVFNAGQQINFCAGYISVDNLGRVWFKGTDNNIWCWDPYNGNLGQITTDGTATGEVVMDPCGCWCFYNNTTNHTLHQLCWWGTNPGNGWKETAINSGVQIVKNSLAWDDVNQRLYFIDVNNAVRYYSAQYNASNPNDLTYTILGHLSTEAANSDNVLSSNTPISVGNNTIFCDSVNNAASCLTLSYDKSTLYYVGTDNNIWYYFNDHDPFSRFSTGGNWNKTALNYNVTVNGPLVLEQDTIPGRLYYAGSNAKLYEVDWTPANNDAPCQLCGNTDPPPLNNVNTQTKALVVDSTTDSIPVSKQSTNSIVQIRVFPNPSENTFTITISNITAGSNVELKVEDLSGRPVYTNNSQVPYGSTSHQLVWDATPVNSGIYIYRLKLNGRFYTGKMAKL
jgi:hypothetical protein